MYLFVLCRRDWSSVVVSGGYDSASEGYERVSEGYARFSEGYDSELTREVSCAYIYGTVPLYDVCNR
jgi:hypothetical protein